MDSLNISAGGYSIVIDEQGIFITLPVFLEHYHSIYAATEVKIPEETRVTGGYGRRLMRIYRFEG